MIPLNKIADHINGDLRGDRTKEISGVAPFEHAGADEITYAGTARFLKKIEEASAGAVIVPMSVEDCDKDIIRVENPQAAFAKVIRLFHPLRTQPAGISPHACIGENFSCGREVSIAPGVVVQGNVTVGDRTTLHPNAVVGDGVILGDDVIVYPNVTIGAGCRIGNRVIIHAGSVIGSDGFGFAPDGEMYHKIPHIGIVQIDDDVEIGAGNTIDRATFGKTWIQKGVKTDNLVHVGHNVTVGENTVLVAQVGISGSVTIGKHAILAGQAGIAQHLRIGDHAIVGPRAGISKDVPNGEIVSGAPEMPHKLWLRVQRLLPRLPELKKRLSDLEKRFARVEEKQ
jgi:UDP-3-O-[3-hydroxymyristoyl] glucosamine N-acyltransferase